MRSAIALVSFLLAASVLVVLGLSAETSPNQPSPVLFIENVGQFADGVRFQVRGPGETLWLTDDAIWADVTGRDGTTRLRVTLPDVQALRWSPHSAHATTVSYLRDGGFPDVPVWHGVRAESVYPGVDLLIGVEGAHLTASWSDGAIRPIRVDGIDATTSDQDSGIADLLGPGVTLEARDAAGRWVQLDSAQPSTEAIVAHSRGPDDLQASTFVGSDGRDVGLSIALDDAGAVYVGGTSNSLVFTPTVGLLAPQHGVDVFVLKLTPDLSALEYVTWVNPNPDQDDDEDHGLAVGVAANGAAYLAGWTISPDLCAAVGAPPGFDTSYNGNRDGYAFKLNPAGTQATACTYLGGSDGEVVTDLAVHTDGTVVAVGETDSADFPSTDGSSPPGGSRSLVVTRFNSSLTALQSATVIGGTSTDIGRSVAVVADGRIAVTGVTRSADFPTTPGAHDTTANGGADAFLLQLAADGETVTYASYLGGTRDDNAWSVALDGSGQAVVAGTTFSDDFPVSADAFDPTFNHPSTGFLAFDGFVARLAADGSTLTYGTYLGGDGFDEALAVGVVPDGSVMVGGFTTSADFPLSPNPFQSELAGAQDGFLVRLQPGSASLTYSTLLGGALDEQVNGLAVTASHQTMLVGETISADFPTTPGASDTTLNGDYDVFVSWLTAGPLAPPTPTPTPTATPTPTPTVTPPPPSDTDVWLPLIVNP